MFIKLFVLIYLECSLFFYPPQGVIIAGLHGLGLYRLVEDVDNLPTLRKSTKSVLGIIFYLIGTFLEYMIILNKNHCKPPCENTYSRPVVLLSTLTRGPSTCAIGAGVSLAEMIVEFFELIF